MTAAKGKTAAVTKQGKALPSLVDQIEAAFHSTSVEQQKEALIAVAKRVEALEQQ